MLRIFSKKKRQSERKSIDKTDLSDIIQVEECLSSDDLKVASCTLAQLLNSNEEAIITSTNEEVKGQLTIPEYQRPYVWGEKQINRLLSDLMEHNKNGMSKPMYYLGSIILHNDNGKLKIIDGQQRITTALLINKIKKKEVESGIKFSSTTSIKNIKRNLSYLNSIKNMDVFEFRDVKVFDDIDFEDINVTLVITETEDLAYTFFETQNTGGVRLAGSDILKAHHLRAIEDIRIINYQARRWESKDNDYVEEIIKHLTKIRYWDNRKWRHFPFYRDKRRIKDSIIDEYTLKTNGNTEDISYYYSAVQNKNGRLMQMHESTFKQLKQPLANGGNTLDYINEYIELHNTLFNRSDDYRISEKFYDFRDAVLHGKHGTVFLKELFEISTIAYVSRFGFHRLFEASLWLYRAIFSMRVSHSRNVREDSVFKFVNTNQFIDNILEVFTPDELFHFLKRYRYDLNTDNIISTENKSSNTSKIIKLNTVKTRHFDTLRSYFGDNIKHAYEYMNTPREFDKDLVIAINKTISGNGFIEG